MCAFILQGDPGVPGKQGLRGDPGVPGKKGLRGDPGVAGGEGRQGLPGVDGARGLPGGEGLPGEAGAAGARGEKVPAGVQTQSAFDLDDALQGSTGDRGMTGPTGPSGPMGFPGTSHREGRSESDCAADFGALTEDLHEMRRAIANVTATCEYFIVCIKKTHLRLARKV